MQGSATRLALLLVLAGCDDTELIVVVDTDMPLSRIELRADGPTGSGDRVVQLGPSGSALPLVWGLVPEASADDDVTITVDGFVSSGSPATVSGRAIVRFAAGDRRVVRMMLSCACAATSCSEGTTCASCPGSGACEPTSMCRDSRLATDELPVWDGQPVRLRDGTSACAPATDGGVDAGRESCNGEDEDGDGLTDEDFVLTTDVHNCGACDADCTKANLVDPTCASGQCNGDCMTGWGDCNRTSLGCETDLSDTASHCGACGHGCQPGEACMDGICEGDRVLDVAAGSAHTCVSRAAGTIQCWGAWRGADEPEATLQSVESAPGAPFIIAAPSGGGVPNIRVASNGAHTCAIDHHGSVYCWGGDDPSLWDTPTARADAPFAVEPERDHTFAGAGMAHTCVAGAVIDSPIGIAPVRCKGRNDSCQLCDPSDPSSCPGCIWCGVTHLGGLWPELGDLVAFDVGAHHTCVVSRSGGISVWCWGLNDHRQLGHGSPSCGAEGEIIGEVVSLHGEDVTAIAAGWAHTCAVVGGRVECWGSNSDGQLGDGTGIVSAAGTLLPLENVATVTAGERHTCALHGDGTVTCWGAGGRGQVGDGVTGGVRRTATPVRFESVRLERVVRLDAGRNHTCALRDDSTVVCWGDNASLQLGEGASGELSAVPVRVPCLPWDAVGCE